MPHSTTPCSSLQASCQALLATHSHLHHDSAAVRLNMGALAGSHPPPNIYLPTDQASLEKLTPWIITSPPNSNAMAQMLGRKPADLSPFVSLSFSQPAKAVQEPTVLQLSVAPIDVIYSQLCLLSLLDFLNAAWPAANLDPLKVRASVSLQEIVQETLQKQQHIMQRQQQRNTQRTKVRPRQKTEMWSCHKMYIRDSYRRHTTSNLPCHAFNQQKSDATRCFDWVVRKSCIDQRQAARRLIHKSLSNMYQAIAYEALHWGCLQIQVGDVRLMLPCGESQRHYAPEESLGACSLERAHNSGLSSIDLEHSQEVPNMLVMVLAGFQATSRSSEPRLPSFSPAGQILSIMWPTPSVLLQALQDT